VGVTATVIFAAIKHGRDRDLGVKSPSVDFGYNPGWRAVGQTRHSRNRGTEALRITHISVQGSSFTLLEIPQMPISLTGGSSVELKLRFAPASNGGSSGTIEIERIKTTGTGTNRTRIAIKGKCSSARIGP